MPSSLQYDGYDHFSAILARTGEDWLLGMFEVYFDDSGTDGNSDVAVAACYISTTRGWGDFANAWDSARWEEGFDAFHMAEFAAPIEHGHKPFCDWDKHKKEHVYGRLAKIVNQNKRIGIACAVPKKAYDAVVPARMKSYHGKEHYAFAVRMCLMRIGEWREQSGITIPMQYIFDWEDEKSDKRREVNAIWDNMHESWQKRYGVVPDGIAFQKRKAFKPLQAADILAWQMRNHMRKISPLGHDESGLEHYGFRVLREDQNMDLGFFSEEQLRQWVQQIEEGEREHGVLSYP